MCIRDSYLREHLGIRSPALLAYPRVALPPCPRTLEYLFRSKPTYGSANFGGSPRTKGAREMADLAYSEIRPECDDAACRSDPTFTRASPGLAVTTGNSLKLSKLAQAILAQDNIQQWQGASFAAAAAGSVIWRCWYTQGPECHELQCTHQCT